MPILNRDILHEILIESIKKHTFREFSKNKIVNNRIVPKNAVELEEKYDNFRSLANFMMAGKETFKIALNYFGQAMSVKVDKNKIVINLPNSCDKVKQFEISYDFPLLKPILAAAGSSIEELDICNASSMAQQRNVLDYLIRKDLKKVSLSTKLPECYNNLLKRSQIECMILSYNSFEKLTMIPVSCRFLRLHRINITHLLDQNIKISFPNELVIDDARMQNLNIKKLKQLAPFISYTFPALESLDVDYDVINPKNWGSIKEPVLRLEPSIFNKLSPKVKGSIHINRKELESCNFQRVIRETHGKPYITIDRESERIEKTFEIHNGMSFSSSFSFDYYDDRFEYETVGYFDDD